MINECLPLRVLCIGDSYGLPRFAKSGTSIELYTEETYPERLRRAWRAGGKRELLLANHCRHANTTFSLLCGEADALLFLRAQYVVVQLGLTDLWPSAGRNVEPLQSALRGKDPWVAAEEFEQNLSRFISFARLQGCRILLVGIPKIAEPWYRKLPRVRERTMRYNQICRRLGSAENVQFIHLYQMIEQMGTEAAVGSDGIHPTRAASANLARMIFEQIETGGELSDGLGEEKTSADR